MASVPEDQATANGGIELSLTLGNLEEIERWILSWGSHAQVQEPTELNERISKTVSALAATYGRRFVEHSSGSRSALRFPVD